MHLTLVRCRLALKEVSFFVVILSQPLVGHSIILFDLLQGLPDQVQSLGFAKVFIVLFVTLLAVMLDLLACRLHATDPESSGGAFEEVT